MFNQFNICLLLAHFVPLFRGKGNVFVFILTVFSVSVLIY